MDYKLFLASVLFVIIGVVIMRRNRFYKYEADDMLFATKFKVFLSGVLFLLLGFYGVFSELAKTIL
jgi:hypothetical protein